MAQIKINGFSLTVFPAKTQRFFLSSRIAGSGLLLAILLLHCLLTAGCVKHGNARSAEIPNPNGGVPFRMNGLELENTRFELFGFPDPDNTNLTISFQPALTYWVKAGDRVAAKWDTFEFHYEPAAVNSCTFTDNTPISPDQQCLVCDACAVRGGDFTGLPCLGVQPVITERGAFVVEADAGFIKTSNPEIVFDMVGNASQFLGGCPNSPYPTRDFAPPKSGLYRLSSYIVPTIRLRGEANGEAKIHALQSGASMRQKAPFRLNQELIDGTNYWFWETTGDNFWLENFSPNLHVTDIRILKGKCEPDPASGKECLSAGEVVKPSRIIFLPDFQAYNTVSGHPEESLNRCYSSLSPTVPDGNYINLTACRQRFDTLPGDEVEKFTTPTYRPNNWLGKLTWLVEFNTGEGADSDLELPGNQPMPPETEMVIEFTIEAN